MGDGSSFAGRSLTVAARIAGCDAPIRAATVREWMPIPGVMSNLCHCYRRSMVVAALDAAPERNVMGTDAVRGTPAGIQKLTCVTPP